MTPPNLASRDSISIFFYQGQHIALVAGRKPANAEVELTAVPGSKSLFHLRLLTFHTDRELRETDTYYLVRSLVCIGPKRPFIFVAHSQGTDRVLVESLSCRRSPNGHDSAATGYSNDFQLDQAFADALRQLPICADSPAKAFTLIDIVALGAIYGGFSGFSRLFVRLEQSTSKKRPPYGEKAIVHSPFPRSTSIKKLRSR